MLDEEEFLSPYGIRSLSRFHEQHPYVFDFGGKDYRVAYTPAESDSGMFGGNSNWRGPVWLPMNVLLIRALVQFHVYYGDSFRVECPTGSGKLMTLFEVAHEIAERLQRIFLREPSTHPAASGQASPVDVFGGTDKFQTDPHWRDCIPFYEYFHGDNGAGLGASHQTGWTACVAMLAQIFGTVDLRRCSSRVERVSSRCTASRIVRRGIAVVGWDEAERASKALSERWLLALGSWKSVELLKSIGWELRAPPQSPRRP